MPDPRSPMPPQRTATGRLGEGLVMTVAMLIFRLILVWLGLLREPFWQSVVQSALFGAFWVLLTYVWDRIRARRGDR